MRIRALICLLTGSLLAGCSDPAMEEPLPAAPVVAAAAVAVAVDFQTTAPGESPVQPGAGLAGADMTASAGNQLPEAVATEQTLHTVNMFLLEYQSSGGRIPATVEELVSQKIVPKLPPAPVGKRFLIDPEKAMITFADI